MVDKYWCIKEKVLCFCLNVVIHESINNSTNFPYRAVYRKANVYILDDPLSAVDADVGQRLFKICTTGALRSSIVVLVTHHIKYAQLTDAMLVLDKVCLRPLVFSCYVDPNPTLCMCIPYIHTMSTHLHTGV